MKNTIKRNKLLIIVAAIYLILMLVRKDMAWSALDNSSYYLIEMAQILPVIFMLTVSIDVLIPKEWIVKRLGEKSGVFGAVLALAFGSLSAGPIYAAFPIAKTLHKKGASVSNVVVILSTWAVVKVPMLANEAKFLGPKFMVVRWLLTVLCIGAIAWIMGKMNIRICQNNIENKQAIIVKQAYCMGCTACKNDMPEVFAMKNGKAYVISPVMELDEMDDHKRKLLNSVVSKCLSKAIEING